ncbi:MAG: FAD-binding oxidoreductase [Chloroflexi bacterium]|nr:FAD-binding oxidoreductase [Chloroflexota bacterium]
MAAQGPLERQADVVIIGGGIAGCTAAYYLAKRGAKVVLVEKGDLAFEQSGRNLGFVREQSKHPVEVPLVMACQELWPQFPKELAADFEWVQGGSLHLAQDSRELEGLEVITREDRAQGLDTRMLTRQEVKKLVPALEGQWAGGRYSPRDGHADPLKATTAFARAAQEHGAKVYTHCAAEGIELAGGAVSSVVTERGEIKTPVVVCAAGAWSPKVARLAGLDLPMRVVRATRAATNPAPLVTKLAFNSSTINLRQAVDGRFILGGGVISDYDITLESLRHLRMFLPSYLKNWRHIRLHVGTALLRDVGRAAPWSEARRHPFAHTVNVEPRPEVARVRNSLKLFRAMFPGVQVRDLDRVWAGNIDATPDAVPVLGEVARPKGFLFATGFSGHGFGMGPVVGIITSQIILDAKTPFDLRPFRYPRFREHAMNAPRPLIYRP